MNKPPSINLQKRGYKKTKNSEKKNLVLAIMLLSILIGSFAFFAKEVLSANYVVGQKITLNKTAETGIDIYLSTPTRQYYFIPTPGESLSFIPKVEGNYSMYGINATTFEIKWQNNFTVLSYLVTVPNSISSNKINYTLGQTVILNITTSLPDYKVYIEGAGKTYFYLGTQQQATSNLINFKPKDAVNYTAFLADTADNKLASFTFGVFYAEGGQYSANSSLNLTLNSTLMNLTANTTLNITTNLTQNLSSNITLQTNETTNASQSQLSNQTQSSLSSDISILLEREIFITGDMVYITVLGNTSSIKIITDTTTYDAVPSSTLNTSLTFVPILEGPYTIRASYLNLTTVEKTFTVDTLFNSGRFIELTDSSGKSTAHEVKIFDKDSGAEITTYSGISNKKKYNLEIVPGLENIRKIKVSGYNISHSGQIKVELLNKTRIKTESGISKGVQNEILQQSISSFVVDPSNSTFDNGTLTFTAQGWAIYKCVQFNSSQQDCTGTWSKVMDTIPGQEYTLIFNATDPAYSEVGLSVINTLKAQYHPNETAEIIVGVLDKNGMPAKSQSLTVNVTLTSPDNSTYNYTTSLGNLKYEGKGTFRFNFTHTSMEGEYFIYVKASGENVNSEYLTTFKVESNYSFDIERHQNTVVNPWQSEDEVTLQITSFDTVGKINVTEKLPKLTSVIDSAGGIVNTTETGVTITWYNLNLQGIKTSINLTYKVQLPKISPDVEYVGPLEINSGTSIFNEPRAWKLAMDAGFTHIKTVEFIMDQRLVTLNDDMVNSGAIYQTANRQISLPENGINVRNAWLLIRAEEIVPTGTAMSNSQILFNNQNFTTVTATYGTRSAEINPFWMSANVTSAFTSYSNPMIANATLRFYSVNTTLHNVRLFITYEYDPDSPTQIRTIKYPLGSITTRGVNNYTANYTFNISIPEASTSNIQSAWVDIYAVLESNTNLTDANLTARINNDAYSNTYVMLQGVGATAIITSRDALFSYILNGTSFEINKLQNLTVAPSTGRAFSAFREIGGEITVTYNYSLDSEIQSKTVSYFMGQDAVNNRISPVFFTQNISLPEDGIVVKDAWAKLYTSWDSATAGTFKVGGKINNTRIGDLSYPVDTNDQYTGEDIYIINYTSIAGLLNRPTNITFNYTYSAATNSPVGAEFFITYQYYSNSSTVLKTTQYFAGQRRNVTTGFYNYTLSTFIPETNATKVSTYLTTRHFTGTTTDYDLATRINDQSYLRVNLSTDAETRLGTILNGDAQNAITASSNTYNIAYNRTAAMTFTGQLALTYSSANTEGIAPTWSSNSTNDTSLRVGETISHNVLWSDNRQLNSYMFAWTGETNDCNEAIINMTNGSVSGRSNWVNISQTIPISCEGKTITWSQWANDTYNNINSTVNFTYRVLWQPPIINDSSHMLNDTMLKLADTVHLNVSIYHNSTKTNVTIFTINNTNYTATGNYPNYYYDWNCSQQTIAGYYTWNSTYVNDSDGNLDYNMTVALRFFCDPVVPIINATKARVNDTVLAQNQVLKLNISVADNVIINTTIFNINGTNYTASVIGNQSYINWTCTTEGNYTLFAIYTNDSVGNFVYNDTISALNTSWICDLTPPAVSLYFPSNNTFVTRTSLNFTYSVYDLSGLSSSCRLVINGTLNATDSGIASNNIMRNITSNISDGHYLWTVNCTDNAGYTGTNTTAMLVKIDSTPPSINLLSPVNNTLNTTSNNIRFRYNITSELSTVDNCSLIVNNVFVENDTGPIPKSEPLTIIQFMGTGNYNWSISCTDEHGFTGVSQSYNLSVTLLDDSAGPLTDLISPINNSYLNYTSNITFVYLPIDGTGIASCNLYINNSLNITTYNITNNQNNNFTLNTSREGAMTWYVNCTDNSTNSNSRASDIFILTTDITLPSQFNLTSPLNNTITTNLTPTFIWNQTADLNFANYTLQIDNNSDFSSPEYTIYTYNISNTTIVQSLESNSRWYWKVKATDLAGNYKYSSDNFVYVTDTISPGVILNLPTNNSWYANTTVTFNLTGNDTNIAQCQLWANFTGLWQSNITNASVNSLVQTRLIVSGLLDGTYQWNILCNDSAGQSSFAQANYTFKLDSTPPIITSVIINDTDLKVRQNDLLNFTIIASDSFSDISNISINGTYLTNMTSGQWTTYNKTSDFGCSANGNCSLVIIVTDIAGNRNSSSIITLFVDSSLPVIYNVTINDSDRYVNSNQLLTFLVNVSDVQTNISRVLINSTPLIYNQTTKLWQTSNTSTQLNCTSEGACILGAVAYDEVDNFIGPFFINYTIDNTAPSVKNLTINYSVWLVESTWIINLTANITDANGVRYVFINTSTTSNISSIYYSTNSTSQFECIGETNCILTVYAYDVADNVNSTTYFNISVDDYSPNPFSLYAPINDTESTNLTPTFNWTLTLDPNFNNYTFIIAEDIDFTNPNVTIMLNGTEENNTLYNPFNFTINKQYYWKVTAYDKLGHSRQSTQIFTYITDNISPVINLTGPLNNSVINTTTLIRFNYTVYDLNTIQNCSLYIDEALDSSIFSPPIIEKNTTLVFQSSKTNGRYNWSIECFDMAGNKNISDIRYFNVSVAIPVIKWVNAYRSSGATTSGLINLSTVNDNLENSITVAMQIGVVKNLTNATTPNGVGGNGMLISANMPVTFGATLSKAGAAAGGAISWQLFYVNSTSQVLLSQYGQITSGGLTTTATAKRNYTAIGNYSLTKDLYVKPTDSLRMVVWARSIAETATRNYILYWEGGSQTFANISGYMLGFMNANMSTPTVNLTQPINSTFTVTCNVSCQGGYCINSYVYVQMNISGNQWRNINSSSGGLVLNDTLQNNPQAIGLINGTISQYNFTIKSNEESMQSIRCAGESDYSNANNTDLIIITVPPSNSPPNVDSISLTPTTELVAGTVTKVYCNATISDQNGAVDIISVNGTLYHNLTSSMTDADNFNMHYTNATCINTSETSTTKTYSCGFDMYYFANNGTWICNISARDTQSFIGTNVSSTIVSDLIGINITDALNFGSILPGTTTSVDYTSNLSNIGNVRVDLNLWGYARNDTIGDNLSMLCDVGSIPIGNLRYNLTNSGITYAQMQNLSGVPLGVTHPAFDFLKATDLTGTLRTTYWKLSVPSGIRGVCNGTIVIGAVKG